jgi:hypothetical protein
MKMKAARASAARNDITAIAAVSGAPPEPASGSSGSAFMRAKNPPFGSSGCGGAASSAVGAKRSAMP